MSPTWIVSTGPVSSMNAARMTSMLALHPAGRQGLSIGADDRR